MENWLKRSLITLVGLIINLSLFYLDKYILILFLILRVHIQIQSKGKAPFFLPLSSLKDSTKNLSTLELDWKI